MTDCVMGVYAVGNVLDMRSVLGEVTVVNSTFRPDGSNTELYRRFYEWCLSVVDGIEGVFGTLKGINTIM